MVSLNILQKVYVALSRKLFKDEITVLTCIQNINCLHLELDSKTLKVCETFKKNLEGNKKCRWRTHKDLEANHMTPCLLMDESITASLSQFQSVPSCSKSAGETIASSVV